MSKILFISDFYVEHLNGGAENNDSVLVRHLSKNHDVTLALSHETGPDVVEGYDLIIVSNFMFLSPITKAKIEKTKYVIYEHDHKYAKNRDPSKYPDFVIPDKEKINVSFYENALSVIVLSEICKKVLEKNIPRATVHSIGCSLWSEEAFSILRKLESTKKEADYCILESSNPIKRTAQAIEYCEKNEIVPTLLREAGYEPFLYNMARCERLLFLPAVLETFSRVCAEAKMLNLSLTTIPKKLGFASEDIFDLSGIELIDALEQRNAKALNKFESFLEK